MFETIVVNNEVKGFVRCGVPNSKIRQQYGTIEAHSALENSEIKRIDASNGSEGEYEIDPKSKLIAFSKPSNKKGIGNTINFDHILQANNRHNVMQISPKVSDYSFAVVLGFVSDMVNSNGISLPYKELIKAKDSYTKYYETWKACPIYVEHDNKVLAKSKGVIVDVLVDPLKGYDGYNRMMFLLAVCREKDKQLHDDIVSGLRTGYSIGATTPGYQCSACGKCWQAGSPVSGCNHVDANAVNFKVDPILNRLVYAEAREPTGFEISVVNDPAYPYAVSNTIIQEAPIH